MELFSFLVFMLLAGMATSELRGLTARTTPRKRADPEADTHPTWSQQLTPCASCP